VSWSSSTTTWPTSAPATATARSIRVSQPERNWEHLLRACAIADLVTVSTPKLAEVYAPHGRFVVLRNFVPAAYLAIEGDPHDGVYVGWSGSIETHPYDLQTTGRGVASALTKTGAQMAIVGNAVGVPKALQCGRVVACGYMPIEQYPVALAQFDVGIVPLEAGGSTSASRGSRAGDGLRRRAVRGDTDRRVFTPGAPRGRPARRAAEPVGGLRQEARP
jgi:hypothetical protein